MEVNTVYQMDALELLRALPDKSVGMVLIDPAYEVHEASWDKLPDIPALWVELKRVIQPRRAIVITCVMRFAWQLIAANPDWFKYDLVGVKSAATDFVNAKNKPLRGHENILVFSDGTTANKSPRRMLFNPQMADGEPYKKINYAKTMQNSVFGTKGREWFSQDQLRINDGARYPTTVLKQKTNNTEGNLHPNEKPQDLFENLIRTYTNEGDLVVDCYAGSGTTAAACIATGRRFIVGDSDPHYVEVTRQRLQHTSKHELKAALAGKPVTTPMFT
jgi:site-specific DNA-methyltransferase (adenine-specific)